MGKRKYKRPTRGVTAEIWNLFDSATGPILPEHLKQLAEKRGWNLGTVMGTYSYWKNRSYYANRHTAAEVKKMAGEALRKPAVKAGDTRIKPFMSSNVHDALVQQMGKKRA